MSPFIGGGSVELACTVRMEVRGYDVFSPLVDFWKVLMNQNQVLADRVLSYYPLSKSKFYELQKSYLGLESPLEKAAAFYVLNRSSFSGTTLSGGMSPGHPRFTLSAIERLRKFKVSYFKVEKADFRDSISNNEDAFLYLDPPYLNGQNLYGHKGDTHKEFNHKTLSELLHSRDRWIMSYNDCETVRNYYSNYQIIPLTWTYGMNKTKIFNEILILSNDLGRMIHDEPRSS